MTNSNKKRSTQLGEHYSTAYNKLRKIIMFDLVKRLGENICYRCNKPIENIDEFSIEHKEHWLDSENPKDLFFGVHNIAFSHLKCNCEVKRHNYCSHGTPRKYNQGCRCELCTMANTQKKRKDRSKKMLH